MDVTGICTSLASVIYLLLRLRTVMGDSKYQRSSEVWVSNIVDQHDPPIDKRSDDRNTCSLHDRNGEELRRAARTKTIAFFKACDRRSAEIVDVRHVPGRFTLNTRIPLNPENRTSGCVIFMTSECRSQWPRGLRRRSAVTRLLRLWVRIPRGTGISVCCECCVLLGRGL